MLDEDSEMHKAAAAAATTTEACYSDDYVSNVCLKHLMRSCINCTINKQYTRSGNHLYCSLKKTTPMSLSMTTATATTEAMTSTIKMTMVRTRQGAATPAMQINSNSSKSQGANSRYYAATTKRQQQQQQLQRQHLQLQRQHLQQQQQHTTYTNTLIGQPSLSSTILNPATFTTTSPSSSSPSAFSSSPAASSIAVSVSAATATAPAAAPSTCRTSVSISSPYLHTVYSKKHMGRRKRSNNDSMDDGINSCLRILLIVSFIKPLYMCYHFIKSVVLTSLKPTERLQQHQHYHNNRAVSVMHKKSTSASASPFSAISTKSSSSSISNLSRITSSPSSSTASPSRSKCIRVLPPIRTTSFITLLTIICLETILLSTMSSCAKTFYMHWNTSNSIFRIDNTDHIIDVNKGNLAFEFDQVHIICPVYEPGTYENETEKYIIYNVSKVEYETCRITNADPRVIAICDKPQKLMFFTITFRPFTPQPGGLEFLPGNDYYFISTSSKDDLYRRIGGRCSTDNMKVVFKVCCVSEEKNKTIASGTGSSSGGSGGKGGSQQGGGGNEVGGGGSSTAVGGSSPTDTSGVNNGILNVGGGGGGMVGGGNTMSGEDINLSTNINRNQQFSNHPHHVNNINTIGINGINTGMLPNGVMNPGGPGSGNNYGLQMNPMLNSPNGGGGATSINTNIDQYNRIPMQPNSINVLNNNIGGGGGGLGLGSHGGAGIMMTPGGMHNGITMISTGGGGGGGMMGPGIPGIHQYHGQTGIRINNVPSTHHTYLKNINSNNNNNNDHDHQHYDKHPNEVVKNEELTYNSAATRLSSPFSKFFSWWHWLCRIAGGGGGGGVGSLVLLKATTVDWELETTSLVPTLPSYRIYYNSLLNYVLRINKQFVNFKSILYNNLIYSIIALFVILLIQFVRYNFVLKITNNNHNNNDNTNDRSSSLMTKTKTTTRRTRTRTTSSATETTTTTTKTNFLTSYDNMTHKKFINEQEQQQPQQHQHVR
uniref:Ephrin RBD domain-containing protein n=1 Tax=Stomoxys calcitrans TaxID=35570 RepID=A0A1I8QF41_STOCA